MGVCIGGTCLDNGWDEKVQLGVQGILKINHNCSSADKTATQIFLALDDFYRDFTELSLYNISLDIHICGYSLGGLFAQVTTVLLQDWANVTHSEVKCRTYESPGVPEMYHEISRHFADDADTYWKERVSNFKSLPNPLNTVFEDIGRVFHLKNTAHIKRDTKWVMKCIAGSTKRILFWTSLMKGFGITSIEKTFDCLDVGQQRQIIGVAMALELGMDLCEIVRTHDVQLMLGCFNDAGEMLPNVCVEMRRWPIYANFEETAMNLIQNVTQGLVLLDPRNAGLHTLFLFGGKRGFVERKLSTIPGYLPMSIKNDKPKEVAALEA